MNCSLIIADDDSSYSAKVAALLRKHSIETKCIANGLQAAEKLNDVIAKEGKLPAIIIVEFSLPGLTGVELLSKLSREGNLCTVIALSSDFTDLDLRNFLRTPFVEVIKKSSPQEVVEKILNSSAVKGFFTPQEETKINSRNSESPLMNVLALAN